MPSVPVTSCAYAVSWPWPCEDVPAVTTAVPSSSDLAGAELGAEAGPLDVGAEAEAELDHVAAVAPRLLVGAQLLVAGVGEALLQRRVVLARVVVGARHGLVRELVDEVLAADVGRVHPDLDREHVDRALHQRRRLRAPGAAVGADRRRVGHDGVEVEVDLRDLVDARGHQAGQHRHQRRVGRIGAAVGDHADLEAGDLAVAGAADLDVLHLRAAVLHLDHRLRARLDVAHGLARACAPARRRRSAPGSTRCARRSRRRSRSRRPASCPPRCRSRSRSRAL